MSAKNSLTIFWCDLGGMQGSGHAMRCIALAEEVSRSGREILFVLAADSVPFVRGQLEKRGFPHIAPLESTEETLRYVSKKNPSLVVIDSYLLPESVYSACFHSFLTVAIVDGDPGFRRAHLFLDQNIGAEADSWNFPDECEHSVRLAGLDYALIRDEIVSLRPQNAIRMDGGLRAKVLVVLGGTDPYRVAPTIAAAMVMTGEPFEMTVIAADESIGNEISALHAGDDQEIRIISPTEELPHLIVEADFVVSASGTSSWELLCLGTPTVFTCVADNQATSYQRLIDTEIGIGIGEAQSITAHLDYVVSTLKTVLCDSNLRNKYAMRAWESLDGLGRKRVLDTLEALNTQSVRSK